MPKKTKSLGTYKSKGSFVSLEYNKAIDEINVKVDGFHLISLCLHTGVAYLFGSAVTRQPLRFRNVGDTLPVHGIDSVNIVP